MRALVFRSAYSASRNARASAAFAASIKAHCAVSSETLMLQVRFAHPPPAHRTSSSSCSGVPVGFFRKGHAMAFSPKRSTFRFASLALRWAGEAPLSPCCAPSRLATRWCSGRLIGCAKRSTFRFASLTLRCRTESALQAAPVFRMAYFPYLTAFRMQPKQIQRLPLRGAGAKRLKGGPWG